MDTFLAWVDIFLDSTGDLLIKVLIFAFFCSGEKIFSSMQALIKKLK